MAVEPSDACGLWLDAIRRMDQSRPMRRVALFTVLTLACSSLARRPEPAVIRITSRVQNPGLLAVQAMEHPDWYTISYNAKDGPRGNDAFGGPDSVDFRTSVERSLLQSGIARETIRIHRLSELGDPETPVLTIRLVQHVIAEDEAGIAEVAVALRNQSGQNRCEDHFAVYVRASSNTVIKSGTNTLIADRALRLAEACLSDNAYVPLTGPAFFPTIRDAAANLPHQMSYSYCVVYIQTQYGPRCGGTARRNVAIDWNTVILDRPLDWAQLD